MNEQYVSKRAVEQAARNQYDGPAVLSKNPPMVEATTRLDASLTFLEEMISGLERRLEPIMTQRPSTAEKDDMAPAGNSHVVMALHDFQCRLHRAASRLRGLSEGLEL